MPKTMFFLGLSCGLLVGCGDFSHDVSHSRVYQSGGFIPGHVYRLKTNATVVNEPMYPNHRYLERGNFDDWLHGSSGMHPLWHITAGSLFRVDSLYHSLQIGLTETSTIDLYGIVLGHEDLPVQLHFGKTYRGEHAPLIPAVDPRYLEDINPLTHTTQ